MHVLQTGVVPVSRGGLLAVTLLWLLVQPAWAEIRVMDDAGQTVILEQPAQRIISLAPYITELLFAAGAGAAVAAVTEFSDYPEAARSLLQVGGGSGLDLEAITALNRTWWWPGRVATRADRWNVCSHSVSRCFFPSRDSCRTCRLRCSDSAVLPGQKQWPPHRLTALIVVMLNCMKSMHNARKSAVAPISGKTR